MCSLSFVSFLLFLLSFSTPSHLGAPSPFPSLLLSSPLYVAPLHDRHAHHGHSHIPPAPRADCLRALWQHAGSEAQRSSQRSTKDAARHFASTIGRKERSKEKREGKGKTRSRGWKRRAGGRWEERGEPTPLILSPPFSPSPSISTFSLTLFTLLF